MKTNWLTVGCVGHIISAPHDCAKLHVRAVWIRESKLNRDFILSYQLLAVATPTVFFHFYSMYMSGEIQKLKTSEEKLRLMEDGEADHMLPVSVTTSTCSPLRRHFC